MSAGEVPSVKGSQKGSQKGSRAGTPGARSASEVRSVSAGEVPSVKGSRKGSRAGTPSDSEVSRARSAGRASAAGYRAGASASEAPSARSGSRASDSSTKAKAKAKAKPTPAPKAEAKAAPAPAMRQGVSYPNPSGPDRRGTYPEDFPSDPGSRSRSGREKEVVLVPVEQPRRRSGRAGGAGRPNTGQAEPIQRRAGRVPRAPVANLTDLDVKVAPAPKQRVPSKRPLNPEMGPKVEPEPANRTIIPGMKGEMVGGGKRGRWGQRRTAVA